MEDSTQEIRENENGVCLLGEGLIRVLFSVQKSGEASLRDDI